MPTSVQEKPKVALVLSSGGARGYAHIGAIEELQARGYEVSSVAGTSMGALVGGLFCTGEGDKVKDWLLQLTRTKVYALSDFTLSFSHLVKGERIINALNKLVPDRRIEDLPVNFRAIATDLQQAREVVFDRGSLYAAIRASISIPTYFSPLQTRTMLLVDGGLTNPLPLNRVKRQKGDILVAVNVSAPFDVDLLKKRHRLSYIRRAAMPKFLRSIYPTADSFNYYSLLVRSFNTQIQRNCQLSLRLMPPDVLVSIPMNLYSGNDYDHAAQIIAFGRQRMAEALDAYEAERDS